MNIFVDSLIVGMGNALEKRRTVTFGTRDDVWGSAFRPLWRRLEKQLPRE